MLEKMGGDTESDPCRAAGDDIDLIKVVSSVFWQLEWQVALDY